MPLGSIRSCQHRRGCGDSFRILRPKLGRIFIPKFQEGSLIRNQKSFRDNWPVWAVFSIIVLWLGALAATAYEDGMNLFVFMEVFTQAMNSPLSLKWKAHTPKFLLGALNIYIISIAYYYSNQQNRRPGEEHGSAHWGKVRELNRKYSDKDPGKNVILTQHLQMSLNARQHLRNLLQVIVGGSGSGKSRSVMLPNLLLGNASFIVTDPKGELLRSVGAFLLKCGYVLRVFDLIEPSHSDSYNPFRYIRKDSDVFRLIDNFIKNTTPKNASQKAAGDLMKKATSAMLKAIQSAITMLAGIFGGVGLAVILMVVLMIGAILASPFGILFSNEPSDGAIPLSSAVAQISMEYSTRLNELQEGEYENITIEGEPPEWIEVIAVFACHVAGGEDGVDVMVLDTEKVDKLRTVFWDMCVITAEEETEEWTGPTTPTDASTEPTVNLTITIEAKTADDMRLFYSFSESQNDALTELLAEDEMLNSLIGDLNISQEEAMELMNGLPSDVSETRKAVVRQALTLVGKVNYFWGGKSLVIGWDERWGQPTEVWAAGSPSTGTIRPYGLDCSGFVDWVFYNVSGGSYVLGHGGGVATQHVYCQDIPWDQAQPGDLIFYPDDSHAGIVGGWDDAGNMMVIHCASGMNNVVITGASGFATVGRPYYYGE